MTRLMRRAQDEGAMDPEAHVDDVRVFLVGTGYALDPSVRGDLATWQRAAERFLVGLRAQA
jgi:hypothetical protein